MYNISDQVKVSDQVNLLFKLKKVVSIYVLFRFESCTVCGLKCICEVCILI